MGQRRTFLSAFLTALLILATLAGGFGTNPASAQGGCPDEVVNDLTITLPTIAGCELQLQDPDDGYVTLCNTWAAPSDPMANCPTLTDGHEYKVVKFYNNWANNSSSKFTAFAPIPPSGCPDEVVSGLTVTLPQAPTCELQLQDPDDGYVTLCNTWAAPSDPKANCPTLTDGHEYKVVKFFNNWANNSSSKFTALAPAPPSGCADLELSNTTISGGTSGCYYVVQKISGGAAAKCESSAPISCTGRAAGDHKVDKYSTQPSWANAGSHELTVSTSATVSGPTLPVRNVDAAPYGIFNLARPGVSSENILSQNLDLGADPESDQLLITTGHDVPETAYASGGFAIPNEGNFRVSCQYSHFGWNDSILNPGQEGQANHLHMFFGNTAADSTTGVGSNLTQDSGGGSCNGYAVNRSAYWVPALLDGDGNALVPYSIIIYYKTKQSDVPGGIAPMPSGLKMIAGNSSGSPSFALNTVRNDVQDVFWQCGESGSSADYRTTIPTDCAPGQEINATIRFPQCLRFDTSGNPVLESDAKNPTHTELLDDPYNDECSEGFERMPELSVLMYWKQPTNPSEVAQWKLSSDMDGSTTPGGTLHADWIGGWHQDVMADLVDNCLENVAAPGQAPTGLNCGFGDLGDGRHLAGGNLRIEPQVLYRVPASELPVPG